MLSEASSWRKQSEEVLVAESSAVRVCREEVNGLKIQAANNLRQRVRLCTHQKSTDALHEMLIVHRRHNYIRPHMHIRHIESFHVIEGFGDVILFDDSGEIQEVIPMGSYSSGCQFYIRLSPSIYHSLLIKSEVFIFHEITEGPFQKENTIFAPWSPEENDLDKQSIFTERLEQVSSRQGITFTDVNKGRNVVNDTANYS